MSLYTLRDLLDVAIGSPEKGAVNFNVLYLVLKTVIEKTDIGNTLVEWKQPDLFSLMNKMFGKDDTEDDYALDELESYMREYEDATRDRGSNTDPVPEIGDFIDRIYMLEENTETLSDKMAFFREEVDKLKALPKYGEEFKKRVPLNQEDVENILDDMGEAIGHLGLRLKEHREVAEEKFQTLQDHCLQMTEDFMAEYKLAFNKKLQDIAIAVRTLQKLFKDMIYPGAPGVTKCLTCGRNAHLPHLQILDPLYEDNICKCPKSEFTEVPIPARRMKTNDDKNQIKFTLLSLNKFKKGSKRVPQDHMQNVENKPVQDNREEKEDLLRNVGISSEPFFNLEAATDTFPPLRYIRDTRRFVFRPE